MGCVSWWKGWPEQGRKRSCERSLAKYILNSEALKNSRPWAGAKALNNSEIPQLTDRIAEFKLAQVAIGYLSQPFPPDTTETVLGNYYCNGWLMSCTPQGVISLLITRFSNLTSHSDCSQWQPFYLHNAKLALRHTINTVMLQLSSALPSSIKLYIFSFTPWGSSL